MARRLMATLCAGAAALAVAGAAGAQGRVALVIGNSAYPAAQTPLPNARNDARGMAAALREIGFTVVEVEDGSRAAMSAALERFASTLKKDDIAVFYYAGHGLQGPAARAEDGLDNYLVPVDTDIGSADQLPRQTVALGEVLRKLDAAKTAGGVVILDACRQNPFVEPLKLGRKDAGLAQPTPNLMRGVYIAFATAPGSTADDGDGKNGRFTEALLQRIRTPGQTVSRLFNDVGIAVEQSSSREQSPWSSSTGGAAELMLVPGAALDISAAELDLYREGLKCDSAACFDNALSRVQRASWRTDLRQLKDKLGARMADAVAATPKDDKPLASPAPDASGLLPAAGAFVKANSATASGRLRVAHAYAGGTEGLPHSSLEAFRWTEAAATGGDATALYELGILHRDGLGTLKNRKKALALLIQASDRGSLNGTYEASRLYTRDAQDMPKDYGKALALLRKGADAGDSRAMYQIGAFYGNGWGVKEDGAEGLRWIRMAADKGNVDGIYGMGTCYNNDFCGVARDPAKAVSYFVQAADRGSPLGATAMGTCYELGQCGMAQDAARAFEYFQRAADMKSPQGTLFLANHYDKGLAPVQADPVKAMFYYRRAAELGDPLAMMFLGVHYDLGSGVEKNRGAARFWYEQAANAGSAEGKKALAALDGQVKREETPLSDAEGKKMMACRDAWLKTDKSTPIFDYIKACQARKT